MQPLICPQCGGAISDYSPEQNFATCGYCATRFLISTAKSAEPVRGVDLVQGSSTAGANQIIFLTAGFVAIISVAAILIALAWPAKKTSTPVAVAPGRPVSSPSAPRPSPTAAPDPNILTFGGKGTGDGLFTDAAAIAVDHEGRIYVGDGTMRVQQFDDQGRFLKLWQIPDKGRNYSRARSINKVAVDRNGRMYVGVGGVILVYDQASDEPLRTIQVAPDYIQDFAVKSDLGLIMVSRDGERETISFVNSAGRITRRMVGFHSDASDAQMSPRETGLAAIRAAVDGAGNIYSVYAFGALGSYELSYNGEDMMIFRFNAAGKYVDKFGNSMHSCGISVDRQSRIYVSERDVIHVLTNNGEFVADLAGMNGITAFTLDRNDNVYALLDDVVVKRAAVE